MSEIFFRVYKQAAIGGFMRELGKERWMLLCVLSSYMDEDGKCYPTQDQLAKDMGVTRQTVNRITRQLKDFKWNGNYVVTVVQNEHNGFRKNNIYTITANPFIQKFNRIEDDPAMSNGPDTENSTVSNECDTNNTTAINNINGNIVITTAKDVVTYFAQKYREQYNVNYSVNWKRDSGMGKKLLNSFPGQVQEILDVVFAEFETRWKRDKYPRPSLGALVSWMGNDALALVDEVRAREARLEAAQHEEQQDVEAIMARLNRRRACGSYS